MVTGGVASVIYGDPRFTRDIDIVLALDPADAERFAAAFDDGDFYVPPIEAIRREAGRAEHGHFNVIHRESGLRADIYMLSGDRLHAWGFERRREVPVGELSMSVAPPEYVIVRKLEYHAQSGSDRHLRDVASMLRISADVIDVPAVETLAEELGLTPEWRVARAHDAG